MSDNDIAIVGMACRLPGAHNPRELWRNLREGVESVKTYTDEELLAAGVKREALRRPNYIKAGAPLARFDCFDAEFFGFSPKEAAIMDPQHRQFLECVWEALEDAGHPPESIDGAVGVFAGCGMGSYFMFNLLTNPELVRDVGVFLLRHTGNDKDFLSTRVSYLLNLRGPSINVQTACSTSLVAVHMAVQHLLSGECDVAIAGGVTIEIPHQRGYHYEEGEILSPDGHCRAFDHRSQGTIFGSGTGAVVLRRLKDAIADGDVIHAVIKGTAVNNDGSQKVGYLAPSVDGQAACIAEALAVADVDAESVNYVECHGTGTAMGDPIEVSALTQAFRESTDKKQFCGIGSIKTNIGHLDTAAGVAALLKTTLALSHQGLPPSLNFEKPNPQIDFDASPFFVNNTFKPWPRQTTPRRAGVNSLGVGGTNAFAILEEAPVQAPSVASKRPLQLLVLSGRNKAALDGNATALAAHLRANPDINLADVAYTLQVGRRHFAERRVLAARDAADAAAQLEAGDPKRVFSHASSSAKQSVAFLFPGGGAQYPHMARGLANEPVFKKHLDEGISKLQQRHQVDVAPFLTDALPDDAFAQLERPGIQLPAIFIVEYALAQLFISWGIKPTAFLGHSMGENTAACLSGTMSFDDALGLVALRGRLMDSIEPGGMLSVPMSADDVAPLLVEFGVDLATINAPDLCVVSGSNDQLDALNAQLKRQGVEAQRVKIKIAAHSRLLEPMLAPFLAYVTSIRLNKPTIPWVSNLTGTWVTAAQATSPQYWVDHLRNTVRFADGVALLASDPGRVFLEVGPGKTLSALAKMHPSVASSQAALATLRHPDDSIDDAQLFYATLGRLWAVGGALSTEKLFAGEKRRRVSLPTYAFQSQRYFIEPGKGHDTAAQKDNDILDKEPNTDRWFYEKAFKRRDVDDAVPGPSSFLVFVDDSGIGDGLAERLRSRGDDVITVRVGDSYVRESASSYVVAPEHGRPGYDSLVRDLVQGGTLPDRVVHTWLLADEEAFRPGSSFFHRNQERGFYSVMFLAQAWMTEATSRPLHVTIATQGAVNGPNGGARAHHYPEQATVLGPALVWPREQPGVTVSVIDLDGEDHVGADGAAQLVATLAKAEQALSQTRQGQALLGRVKPHLKRWPLSIDGRADAIDALESEARKPAINAVCAVRGARRYVEELRRVALTGQQPFPLRDGGVVLITGGLGGIGLAIAEHLATTKKARLVLLSRQPLPPQEQWSAVQAKLGPAHETSRRIARVRAMEAAGAEVLTLNADVTDVERMKEVVASVRARFGAVHGVVHAAGVVKDALLSEKRQADVEEVMAPKVYGTLVLDQVTQGEALDMFVVFSSTSTVIAPAGQVDYVAANAFLNAFAATRKGSGRTLALDWGVWSDVGMAASAATRMLAADAHDWQAASHPWFAKRSVDDRGVCTITARFDAEHQWVIADHRTRDGDALLPGAAYVELCRAALHELGLNRPFQIRDLTFFRPLYVADGHEVEARFRLTPNEQGYTFEALERVTLDGVNTEGGAPAPQHGFRKVAQASLWLHHVEPVPNVDVQAEDGGITGPFASRSKQEDHLRFGPQFHVVKKAARTRDGATAWLRRPEPVADADANIALHPGIVDLGTGFAMDLIAGYTGDTLWVPVSYRSATVFGALNDDVRAFVRARPGSSEAAGFAHFDIQLTDPSGRVLLQVQELTIKRLAGKLDLGKGRRVLPGEVEFEPSARSERQLSPSELAFRHNLKQGIRTDEGVAAFVRVLCAGEQHRQVFVSSLDLLALVAQAEAAARQQHDADAHQAKASFARPELASNYEAPRDDVETSLVDIWQDLLGVAQIGVRDSFFDLGGHSLIAVRLFARVKKSFGVEFPISVLFEAPTIAQCAELIRQARGPDTNTSDVKAAPASRPRYRHLVAMHPGEGGPRTPFFLVAGMFGNVLNLRHLANQIGTNRPFYGLQARGLYGGEAPHETFEDMARDYLAEVRLVQPHGPYLLGGFSGGGIAALEMAQQLRRAGEDVALLVMLDTPLPQGELMHLADKLKMHAQNVRREGLQYATTFFKNRLAWELKKRRDREFDDRHTAEGALHSQAIEQAFYRMLPKYALAHYPGAISLFRPKLQPTHVFGEHRMINRDKRFIYDDNGWSPHCMRVDVAEVPGDHDSMVLEPNVRVLAGRLRKVIEEAEAKGRGAIVVPLPSRDAAQ